MMRQLRGHGAVMDTGAPRSWKEDKDAPLKVGGDRRGWKNKLKTTPRMDYNLEEIMNSPQSLF